MKRFSLLLAILLPLFQCYFIGQSYAEGTKEVRPTINTYGNLSIDAGYTDFATYNCPENYRLNIHISNVGEKILFGFHRSSNTNRTYQLRNPSGTVVMSGTIPTTGTGYIANYNEAVTGPFPGSGGYTPFIWTTTLPAEVGDFYIEFSGSIDFDLFDFTVVSGANTPALPADAKLGRVWSKSWQFYANIGTQPFSAKMFVFSDDGIVTRLSYSNASVGRFTMFCNSVGCTNTGNFTNDRKSKNTNTSNSFPGIAQYKVFCNNPDTLVYVNGVYGVMIGTPNLIPDPAYPLCSGKKLITIEVNKAGNVEIRIDVPYGGPANDVYLYSTVTAGVNNIAWDGLDGTGVPVPDGTDLIITVSYVNGLTNLPLWDIEENPDGFTVTLVRPISTSSQTPLVYWDDTEITLGGGGSGCMAFPIGSNLTGCLPAGSGCHIWASGNCHNKMINTWWYSASSSTAQITAMHIGTPPVPEGQDTARCGPGSVNLHVTVLENETADWYDAPTAGTLLLEGSLNFTTPVLTTTTSYYVEARNDTSDCISDTRKEITAVINPIPENATGDTSVSRCGPGTVTFTASTSGGAGINWYDAPTGGNKIGIGTSFTTPFINDTTSYWAHAEDEITGCVSPTRTEFVAIIIPVPSITNSVLTSSICSQSTTNIALTSAITGTNFHWVPSVTLGTVTGHTADSGLLIAQTLTNTVFIIGEVTYAVTPKYEGCSGTVVNFPVTVYPTPDLSNSPSSISVCNNVSPQVTMTSNVAGTLFTWTCTPSSGNITGWSDVTTPTALIDQTLVNSGYITESVTYHITPEANGCPGQVTDYIIYVYPVPDLTTSPLIHSQCNDQNTGINLTTNVTGSLFTWVASASSGNITGQSNSAVPGTAINQLINNSGNNIDTVYYTIVPHANSCSGDTSIYKVAVFPTPDLSNSPASHAQCDELGTNISLTSNVASTQFTWSCVPSSANITGWSDNGTPATLINQTLDNTGYDIESVTYQVTPNANGCDGSVTDYMVTVYPTPDISNSSLETAICNLESTGITLTSNVTGTQSLWTCTQTSGNITGWSANAGPASMTIVQALTLSGWVADSLFYHITPQSNGCDGPVYNYKVIVNPIPELTTTPMWDSICSETSTNIQITSTTASTSFSWTAALTSGDISGFADGTGTQVSQILTNNLNVFGSVTYTIIPATSSCTGLDTSYIVTVKPMPHLTNQPKWDSICNNTSPNITLTSAVAGTQFTWTCTPSSANVTGWSDVSVPTTLLDQTLVNSGYDIENVIYTITPEANGCDGPDSNFVVTVFPVPDLSNTPITQEQCNNLSTNIALTSNVTNTLFTWTATPSSANITGYSDQPAGVTLIDHTLVNSSYIDQTVTYHITPHANDCDGIVYDYVVTVHPTPDLTNTPLNQSQCNNLNTNIALTSNIAGTQFTWTATGSSGNVTGFSDNTTPATLIGHTLVNSGFDIETVTYEIIPRANSCDGSLYTYVVAVFPTPDLHFNPTSQTLCSGQASGIALSCSVLDSAFSWTVVSSSANITGHSAGSGGSIVQTLSNSGTTIETVTYTVTPSANGCNGPALDVVITVNPVSHVTSAPLAQDFCSGGTATLNLTADVTGTTYAWTATPSSANLAGFSDGTGALISQTLTNTGYTIDTVFYTITPTANGCDGPDSVFTVVVYPIPDVSNNPMFSELCNGTSTNITVLSNVAGTSFSWTATPSSANIIGFGPGSGTLIDQMLTNTGFVVENVTYHITPTANGCTGTVYDFVATVVSQPDVYFDPTAQTICDGETTNVQVLSHVTSATFTWTALASSPNLNGYADGSGPLIAQPITNSGNTIETVTYTATPVAFGCPAGIPGNVVVTVNPTPHVSNNPLTQSICSEASTNFPLTSTVTGTTYAWTATPSSANLSGFSDDSGPSVIQAITNSGYTIETVTYQVTPTANSCDGPDSNVVVTVFPTPDLANDPKDTAICNGQPTGVNLLYNVANTLFTWTATGSSLLVSGYSDNSVPTTLLDQTLTNSGYDIETVTYHVTPIANGCDGLLTDYTVTVYPVPDLSNNPPNMAICNGQSTGLSLLSNVANTQFTWATTASSSNLGGFSDNTTPTTLLDQTLTNSGYTIETVTYHVTPHANGCDGIIWDYTVTVYPTPDLSNNPASSEICNNSGPNVSLTSNVANTLFTWTATASSPNLGGFTDNTTPTITLNQTLTNSGYTIETVTYHLTPHANGCDGTVWDYTVTVYPVPDVSNTPMNHAQCNNTMTGINMTSNVANTLFTWTANSSSPLVTGYSDNTGIPVDLIDQQLVNPTFINQTVTYHITPHANGCDGIVWDYTVTIFPTANLSNSPAVQTQCNEQGTNISLTSNVANTTFTWRAFSNSPNTTGFSNNSGPGATTIDQLLRNDGFEVDTVTYRLMPNANACNGDSTDYRVIVFPTPDMSNDPPASQVCNSTPTGVTLASHVAGTTFTWTCTPSSGLISGWSNNAVPTTSLNQTLVNNGLLIETVTYHMTPSANGCIGPDTNYIVTVVQSPDVYFNPPAETICSEATSNIQILSHVPGTTYDWTTSSSSPNLTGYTDGTGDLIAQSVTNSGTTIETVTYTVSPTAWGCPPGIPGSVVLTVNPEPIITNTDTTFAICSSTNTGIVPQSSVANSSYTWVATGSSANVGGFSDGSGLVIVQQLVNTGFVNETVTYTIRPIANSCSGETRDFVVTVFPVADTYYDPNGEAICTGETCNINILSHVTGSTYTWTAAGSSGAVSGYSGGSGDLIQQTLLNSGYTLPYVTYQVTPAANGCVGTTSQVIVTVNPWPSVDYSTCTDIITTTGGQSIVLKGGIPLGGTYTGTGVNAGVFYPGIAGEGVYNIIYTYTNDMGCTRADSNTITVMAPLPFNCGENLTDIRDGKVYPTVVLGSQCWMASNLNYGNVIASSQVQRDNCLFEKYCLSDNPVNCTSYGGMYQWDEMMDYAADNGAQGFCPPGWHIPTEAEWNTLFNVFISNGFAGNALKYTGYSGFNGQMEGIRFHNSTWRFLTTNPILRSTMIWSSTARGSDKAWAHGMNEVVVDNDYTPSVSFYPSSRINAFSVRCIRD
ncbi:MAG: hypothetical protein IH596_00435 [Bacteroidales bacterium]|nr:hypothetical protein [Bacteroidales bacterium]